MDFPAPLLPIDPALPVLRQALAGAGMAVLQAPPGAGKTTRVPLALLDAPWLAGRGIIVLEPRRLAARAAAHRMAELVGEVPGGLVGYRVRHDTRVSPRTRIEVVTEGVLPRMLQSDPALESVGLVVFDEFHERSIHADLGLALTLQSRAILREDLRILVMSATLDGAPIASLLGGAPVVTSEGRAHPVETRHLPPREGLRVEAAVAAAVRHALDMDRGDVLAFLPGAGEIHRAHTLLAGVSADVIPLHGSLPRHQQDRALRPSAGGRRRVVLATAIAETSLTIDGVRVVVDGGWSRVPKFSPRSGMTRLATVRVSRASADQRRGRAGRQAPGVCYRLWSAVEEAALLPRSAPEILESDLTPLALELAAAGVAEPSELPWLDLPPAAALAEARSLLAQLGALDAAGRITSHGRQLAGLAMHPRLAHMVVRGRAMGAGELACELAALLSDRDLLRGVQGREDADIGLRLEILRGNLEQSGTDPDAIRRARAEARLWGLRLPGNPSSGSDSVAPGVLIALAYPDRIARRRAGHPRRFVLRNGQGAYLEAQSLAGQEYLATAELDGEPTEARIHLAAALELEEIEAIFANDIVREDVLNWDADSRVVVARRRHRLGAIVLQDAPLSRPDPDAVTRALIEGIRREGVDGLPWSGAARSLRLRMAFMHRLDPLGPDVSTEALTLDLPGWLGASLTGIRSWDELKRLDWSALLLSRMSWQRRKVMDEWAPTHIEVPSGFRHPVDYADPAAPALAVRLQELFGLASTPSIAGGRVPLTLHLLSPAGRPVQVTRDLAGFWRTTYFEVRKDLKGRYPKHHWPDDPLAANPTRHAKRRDGKGT
ncbi:MAG TPA: ATP-dependent helicase HrpB [Gemmatimonadales bacterium]|nr:ATP-dependent helicase HrpB [Gemmatimonadales bacterium]